MSKIEIALPKVRLTFPNLFEKQALGGCITTEEARKYTATFTLSKDNAKHIAAINEIKESEKKLLKEIGVKINPHALFKCGDEYLDSIDVSDDKGEKKLKSCSYMKNTWSVTANNGYAPILELIRGVTLDVERDDNPFYAGCYVNAIISLSPYKFNNKWKGLTKYLQLVLFSKAGEKLGSDKRVKSSDYFDDDDIGETLEDNFNDRELF